MDQSDQLESRFAVPGDGAAPDTATTSGLEMLRRSETARLALLDEIGRKRDSFVITYMTSFREGLSTSIYDEDVRILESHIDKAVKAGSKNIDLFLCTHGGAAVMPWNFHAMFRDYLPKGRLGVFVPFEAYSAGTSISLGADEIIMGRSSVLGPTDTQMLRHDMYKRIGVNDLSGFMWLLKDFGGKGRLDDKKVLEWLTQNADPLVLGSVYRVWKENRRKVLNAINSRRKPLAPKEAEQIADFFLYEVGIHGQGIRRREAVDAGVNFITMLEDSGLEDQSMRLFDLYADILKYFSPFTRAKVLDPDMRQEGDHLDFDVNGNYAAHTPVVMIESQFETNPAFIAYGSDRHWNQPPRMDPQRPGTDVEKEPSPPVGVYEATPALDLSWSRQMHEPSTSRTNGKSPFRR
ncbi:MAG: hypothetical protein AAFR21_04750 [Pseudomonadota bacterium]